ncbi:MAG: thermonuclease family protein [Thaumarchaeota archaeon]|nr:thermonuclease family protein [Nitrososphaerota archaeon]
MKKDLVIGIGVGVPVVIIMILIGGGGHTSLDFEREIEKVIIEEPKQTEPTQSLSQDCSGTARCVTGTVTKIVDGDTIHVDGESVRFALASAPELSGYGGVESRNFIQTICPIGSDVIVDEDDGQTGESFGRMIGVIYCNGMNLNAELLDADLGYLENRFCDSSEFASDPWAQKHGC